MLSHRCQISSIGASLAFLIVVLTVFRGAGVRRKLGLVEPQALSLFFRRSPIPTNVSKAN